jgi:5-methylcytosine-specific restriction endonuclease McrA
VPRISYCTASLCPNEATHRGKCARHQAIVNKQTHDPARKRIYNSSEWQSFRVRRIALAHGICERCAQDNAQHVHHIKPLRLGASAAEVFTVAGTEALCISCHSTETAVELGWSKLS